MRNSGPKFYPMVHFGFSYLIKKYPVDLRHNTIKVSPLRSPTNFKKSIFSKTLYKLIYFSLIDKEGRFTKVVFFLENIPFLKFVGLRKGLTLIELCL